MAPLVELATGTNFTATIELRGSSLEKSGAKQLAYLTDPPVSESGITHSSV